MEVAIRLLTVASNISLIASRLPHWIDGRFAIKETAHNIFLLTCSVASL